MRYGLVSDSWDQEEVKAINNVIKSGIYTYKGKYVREFEKKFAKYFNSKYAVMVNSGSSANLIAIASASPPDLANLTAPAHGFILINSLAK